MISLENQQKAGVLPVTFVERLCDEIEAEFGARPQLARISVSRGASYKATVAADQVLLQVRGRAVAAKAMRTLILSVCANASGQDGAILRILSRLPAIDLEEVTESKEALSRVRLERRQRQLRRRIQSLNEELRLVEDALASTPEQPGPRRA